MKLEMNLKKIVTALIGNCILGAGVAMSSQALLGSDPAVSFSQASAIYFGLSFGQMITITNCVLLAITLILAKNNIGIATLIVVLLNQYPIDFVTAIIPFSSSLVIRILWVVLGSLVVAIGCNILIDSDLGMGIYDAFIFGICSKVNKGYVYVRYFVDGTFLLLTYLFKGYIGIGTIISYLLVGRLIDFTKPYIDKIIK